MASRGFTVCEVLRPELKELIDQACVFEGKNRVPHPLLQSPHPVLLRRRLCSLPLLSLCAEGPVCLQIPLLLPSLCLSPPPYISHSRSLFDSVSQGLMTVTDFFQLIQIKEMFFFLSMKAIHMDVIYMKGFKSVSERHFSVLLSQLWNTYWGALASRLHWPCV